MISERLAPAAYHIDDVLLLHHRYVIGKQNMEHGPNTGRAVGAMVVRWTVPLCLCRGAPDPLGVMLHFGGCVIGATFKICMEKYFI